MSTAIQRRRGTTAQHASFAGLNGELTVDTDKKTVVVHDGATAGGFPLARQDFSNVSSLALPAGAAATPVYSFTGDTNTGIYSPGADQVAISTGGSGRLFVDSSGNIGINYSTPSNFASGDLGATAPVVIGDGTATRNLTLFGANNGYGSVAFADSTTGSAKYAGLIQYYHTDNSLQFYTNSTERLRITSAGLVGVGTSLPGASLDVRGNSHVRAGAKATTTQYLVLGSNDGTNPLELTITNSTNLGWSIQSTEQNVAYRSINLNPVGGNVGIGTSSPQSIFHIGASAPANAGVKAYTALANSYEGFLFDYYYNTSASNRRVFDVVALGAGAGGSIGGSDIRFLTVPASATGTPLEAMRIDSQQRVGIGTNSITAGNLLEVRGRIESRNDSTSEYAFYARGGYASGGEGGIRHAAGLLDLRTAGVYDLTFSTNNTERARIDSSGRWLLGTSTSASTANGFTPSVQVAGAGALAAISAGRYAANANPPQVVLQKSRNATIGAHTVVNSGDEVGAVSFEGSDGTGFIQAALISAYVDGTPGTNDMPGRLVFSTTADGASSPSESFRITNTGRGIFNRLGTPTDFDFVAQVFADSTVGGVAVQTNQTGARTAIRFRNPNGIVGEIITNGSATAYNTSSDYRLKENVTAVTDGITRLQQLKPSRFNFIADPNKTVDGFIAHEVQTVVPEAINGEKDAVDADGNPVYQGIDQSKLVPLLTAALQEAIGEIESLKARVAALESA